jgi:uncharacterized protein DUF1571
MMAVLVVATLALTLGQASLASADARSLLLGLESAYAPVRSYTARFVKQERLADTLRPREEAVLKFQRPGRIYLRWTDGPPKGREILYVAGRDDDKLLVREPGFFSSLFTLLLAPDSPRVLQESRHPVTEVGIGLLVERITADVRKGLPGGHLVLSDRGEPDGRPGVKRVEIALAPQATGRYYAPRVLVDVDDVSRLPVGLIAFDGEDQMVERYEYHDVRVNAVLGDLDFDPTNPEYGFPRRWLRL